MAKFSSCFFVPWRRRRQNHRRRGATAVEMALVAPMFFLLFIGTIEVMLMETAQQLIENAAFNTSRLAKTGFVLHGESQSQTVSQELVTELGSFGTIIDTSKVILSDADYNSFGDINGQGASGFGGAKQIVVYTVSYPWKFFTPLLGQLIGSQDSDGNWIRNLTSRIVVRNEPYE